MHNNTQYILVKYWHQIREYLLDVGEWYTKKGEYHTKKGEYHTKKSRKCHLFGFHSLKIGV